MGYFVNKCLIGWNFVLFNGSWHWNLKHKRSPKIKPNFYASNVTLKNVLKIILTKQSRSDVLKVLQKVKSLRLLFSYTWLEVEY